MLNEMRACFDRIPDPIKARDFSLPDCLMSGLAVFSLKMPSLLQFDTQVRGGEDPVQARNLRTLFGVGKPPSDTWMRERLDEVDPRSLRRCFTSLHAALQRGKVLEGWTVLGGHLLISVDGTGHHSSHKVRCRRCCMKNHRDGTKTYYHQALGAAIVHPDMKEVFPLAPEPIRNADGTTKNDCERNAAKRLLDDLRREHPHMKAVIVEDGLASNGPHINLLEEKDFRFILGAKPGDHDLLFSWFEASETKETWERRDRKTGTVHRFEWDHGLPLNDANFDLKVNMLKMRGDRHEGKDAKVLVGHRPPAGPGDGDARHARRAPQMGHRERNVPNAEGAGRIQVRAQFRPWGKPSGGRLRDARHARLPDRPGAAALLPAVPEGARTSGTHPLPLEQAAKPVPEVQHPGLAHLLSRHVGGHEEARTR